MRKAKIRINYNGIIVETEGYKCPKCGEEFLTIEQAKESRRKLALKRAKAKAKTPTKNR